MPPPTVHGFRPWFGSVVVHLLLIALLAGLAFNWRGEPEEQQLALEGRVVGENELPPALRSAPLRPAPPAPRVEPSPEPEPVVPPQPDRTAELQRQAEEQARIVAARQRAEQERAAQERAAREAAEQQQRLAAEAERRRLAAEAEQKRKADQARREQEAQLARQREEDAKAKAARAEADRNARLRAEHEAELRRALASEEEGEAIQRSGIVDEYVTLLTQTIERNWIRPPSARAGLKCTINVTQASGGTVIDVQFGACNGDPAVRESVANAVYRSSPLPPPRDPRAFQRQLMIVFSPTE